MSDYAQINDIVYAILDSIYKINKMPQKQFNYYIDYKNIGIVMVNEFKAIETIIENNYAEGISIITIESEDLPKHMVKYDDLIEITTKGIKYLEKYKI